MSSVFDDPYLDATCRAQTKALYKYQQQVSLDVEKVRQLTLEVKALYRPGRDMVRILEFILDWHEPFTDDAERGGYKIAIGMAMHEVRIRREKQLDELEVREPPLSVYEQDM
jgi:hypothetical protein